MINLKQFISLIDCGQDESTQIIVNIDGEEVATGTLEEAEATITDLKSPLKVVSFVFCEKCIMIECEI